jgi:hypothetical protein
MDAALRYEDPQRLREYADAHRLARGVAADLQSRPAGREVERPQWIRVIDAMNTANRYLARCDDAWLEMRAVYLEVMARNAVPRRVRREPWAESIVEACRYLGPGSATVERMRSARRSADWHGRRGPEREHRRRNAVRSAVERHLRTLARPDTGRLAHLRAIGGLHRAAAEQPIAADIAAIVKREFQAASSDAKPTIAAIGTELCRDLAEVATARELFEHFHEVSTELMAGDDDLASQLHFAEVQCRAGDLCLLNGEVAAAARLAREAEERLRSLTRFHINRADHQRWVGVLNDCDALLADCLLVQGKRSRAAEYFRKAHQGYAVADAEGVRHQERVRAMFNAAVFAAGRWHAAA